MRDMRNHHSWHRRTGTLVGLVVFLGIALIVVSGAHAQSPTGGAQAPQGLPNVQMFYGVQYPEGKVGAKTTAYSAKINNFVVCGWPSCGRIETKMGPAGYRYHVVQLSKDEVVTDAYYGYRVPKRARKYFGKYFGDSNWDGRGPLGDAITLTVKDGMKKYSFKASLEYIEVHVSDPRHDSIPSCQIECGGMVGPDTK
jgi:hypothetical protein